MKFAFALVALLATVGSLQAFEIPNVGNGELAREIQDFLDLLPVDDMLALTFQYLAEDEEFQQTIAYLQSTEFQDLARDVEELPEIKNLMQYIYDAGIDIYALVNQLNQFIGIDPIANYKFYQVGGGLRGFVDDIKALLPMDQLNELYEDKLQNSQVFADFIAQIKSEEFQTIVNTVYANPNFQDLLDKAREAGIDLEVIKELLLVIFGITIPEKTHFFYHHV